MILTRSLGKNPSCKILEKILARSWQVLASDFSKIWRDSSGKIPIPGKILARSWQVLASDFSKIWRDSSGKIPIPGKILARSWQVLASDFSKIWRDSSGKILEKTLARSWQVLASDFSKFDKILEGILAGILVGILVGILAGIPWRHVAILIIGSTHTCQIHLLQLLSGGIAIGIERIKGKEYGNRIMGRKM